MLSYTSSKLRRKAKMLGKTESELLRELVDRELQPRTMGERIGHLQGTLSFDVKDPDSLRQALRERNWRT
jgi:hypothetical protein